MKIITNQSKCVNQWVIHFQNGWSFQSTFQRQDTMNCICKKNCHLLSILPSVPGIVISVFPYRNMRMGMYLFRDDLCLNHPYISYFELNPHTKIAWTIGISGPRSTKENMFSQKNGIDICNV